MFLTDIFPKKNQTQVVKNYEYPGFNTNFETNFERNFEKNQNQIQNPNKKLEDNTEKLENILELKLKEYLSQNENLYDKTKTDLINLINEVKTSVNNPKTNDNQAILDELMQLKTIVRSNLAYNSSFDYHNQLIPKPIQPITNIIKQKPIGTSIAVESDSELVKETKKEHKEPKESKGSYYKVIPSIWEGIKQEFNCLDDKWKDLCYSRGDGIYIKIKKKYEKLDKNNISKIIFKLQNL